MNKRYKNFWTVFWLLLAFMSVTENAYAYLDLGTGNYLIQMIVAGFLTTIFVLKMYFQRFISFIKKLFKSDN
jgi:hypothetical protein